MAILIRRATRADAQALTDVMHASSAYAGDYGAILVGYAVTPEQIDRDIVFLAETPDGVAGFYGLTLGEEAELDLMFVVDNAQGSGLGRELFEHMCAEARRLGIPAVTIVSHPPSVGFYQRMGALVVATQPPTRKATWERPVLSLRILNDGPEPLRPMAPRVPSETPPRSLE